MQYQGMTLKRPEAIQAALDISDRSLRSLEKAIQGDLKAHAVPEKGRYNFKNVPLGDPKVWALFGRGDTKGIFQLEKQLGQDWSKRAKPRNIEELAVLISILRPGPLESEMSDQYVRRKHGEEAVSYLHPALEPILKETYGCLVYQEQAMRIGIELAKFTEVEADNLRKAIGKKKPEEMIKVKINFMESAEKAGIINKSEAEEIFGWIQKSVRYSFNKSHAVSYAMISYLSAYQKVHFPTEFYTSWLTYSDWKPSAREEIYELVQNARLNNVTILPPTIRRSNVDFEISGSRQVVFGLSHIRGVGSAAIQSIKDAGANLSTFIGFLKSSKELHRNVAESLIKSGACDCYELSRTFMLRNLHVIYGRNDKNVFDEVPATKPLTKKEYDTFIDLIDELGVQAALQAIIDEGACVKKRIPTIESKIEYLNDVPADTNRVKSIWEKLYLGLNLTCSAADDIKKIDSGVKSCKQVYFEPPKAKVIMHVVIDQIRLRKTGEKSKNPGLDYCYLNVSDNTGAYTGLVCWPETYERLKSDLAEDIVATIYGRKESWKGRDQIIVDRLVVIG